MKLTAKAVAALALPPGKTDHIEWDDELRRFGYRLRRSADGKVRRSWVCQYQFHGGSRRVLPGEGGVLGAEQARMAARKIMAKVALGQDPAGDRRDRRGKDALTMRSQVEEFLAIKKSDLAARTYVESSRYLTDPGYFGPLHNMPVDTKDVAARVVAIARERGRPTASRARGALGGFFTWTMRMGLAEANPTIGAYKPEENSGRKRVLSEQELVAIWRACGDDEYGRIIRLLILTACRRAEIGDMAWNEIDYEGGTFTIPAGRSKNGRAHTLPLMPMMRDVIKDVPHMATRDQLFGERSHGFTRWGKSKKELDERSEVRDWVVHDIRRSVATHMGEDLGILPHVVEQILNHQGGHKSGVAGVYNKSTYEREVRAALALWCDHVRMLVEGSERKVVAFTTTAS